MEKACIICNQIFLTKDLSAQVCDLCKSRLENSNVISKTLDDDLFPLGNIGLNGYNENIGL